MTKCVLKNSMKTSKNKQSKTKSKVIWPCWPSDFYFWSCNKKKFSKYMTGKLQLKNFIKSYL